MSKFMLPIVLLAAIGFLLYRLGGAHCRTEILRVEKEVKSDVVQRKAEIYAAPAADRALLLKLMRDNVL